MNRTAALLFRATAAKHIPTQVREKIRTKISEFPVSPFGLLQLRVSDCSPKITALDHVKYPHDDRVVVHYCEGCRVASHQTDFAATKGTDPKILALSCSNRAHDQYCSCIIQVPVNIALDISASGDADVKISNIEPASCHISSEYGLIQLDRVKTQQGNIFANSGSVEITGALHGNVTIKAGMEGFVRADRIQGTSVQIDTFHGPINCKAIYGDKVHLSTRRGDITAGNLQSNNIKIWSTDGNVDIGSLEGNFNASLGRGALSANVSKTNGIKVQSMEGKVSLGLHDKLQANLHLEGSEVKTNLIMEHDHSTVAQDSKVSGKFNGGSSDCSIEIVAKNGSISLYKTNWLSSLNLENSSHAVDEEENTSRNQ